MTVARGGFACPKCGKPNDAATPVGDDPAAVPVPGDVLVCIGCATPAIVTANLRGDAVSYARLRRWSERAGAFVWGPFHILEPARRRFDSSGTALCGVSFFKAQEVPELPHGARLCLKCWTRSGSLVTSSVSSGDGS